MNSLTSWLSIYDILKCLARFVSLQCQKFFWVLIIDDIRNVHSPRQGQFPKIYCLSSKLIFTFRKSKVLPWTSPKFISLIFHRRGVAFIFLSFQSSSLTALRTSQVEKRMHSSVIPQRCSFSGLLIWPGPVTSQTVYTSVQLRW